MFFVFPNITGAFVSKFIHQMQKPSMRISTDVTLQHNSSKNMHRKINSFHLAADNFGIILGIILSLFLINMIGFRYSLLVFSLLTVPCIFFYFRVSDNTRFKPKKNVKLPSISGKLKLILFSEIIYWLALGSSFALVITFLVSDRFGGSIEWVGFLFLALYMSMNTTVFITRKFLDGFDLIKTSIFGMFILFLSALVIIFSTNLYWVFFSMILEGIGAGIWVPSKSAVYWKLTDKASREKVSGYLNGWRSFVSAIGPLVGGFLVVYIGILAPFYFKAGITGISILVYWYVLKS